MADGDGAPWDLQPGGRSSTLGAHTRPSPMGERWYGTSINLRAGERLTSARKSAVGCLMSRRGICQKQNARLVHDNDRLFRNRSKYETPKAKYTARTYSPPKARDGYPNHTVSEIIFVKPYRYGHTETTERGDGICIIN